MKETDRLAAIATNLTAMGVEVVELDDGLEIYGGTPLLGARVKSYGDHRIAMAFAIAAEIERDLISQRTTEALQARKQQGMPLGRPRGVGKSKLNDHRTEIEALLKNGSTKTWVANTYQTTVGNLRHWMKQHGIAAKEQPLGTRS